MQSLLLFTYKLAQINRLQQTFRFGDISMTAAATCLSRYVSPTLSADVPPTAEFKVMHKLCRACCVKPGNSLDLSLTPRYKSPGLEREEEENVAPQSSTLFRALLVLLLRLMLNHLCCNDPDHNLRGWCYRKHKKHPCGGGVHVDRPSLHRLCE